MALHAMWVHGTSVRAEWVGDTLNNVSGGRWDGSSGDVAWSNVNGLPRGWGTTFRGKRAFTGSTVGPFHAETPFQYGQKGYRFHFAIPTPVIVADRRARLRLWVRSLSENGPHLKSTTYGRRSDIK
jgi:hypothetical protein